MFFYSFNPKIGNPLTSIPFSKLPTRLMFATRVSCRMNTFHGHKTTTLAMESKDIPVQSHTSDGKSVWGGPHSQKKAGTRSVAPGTNSSSLESTPCNYHQQEQGFLTFSRYIITAQEMNQFMLIIKDRPD